MSTIGTTHVLHVDDPDVAEMAATCLERENEQLVIKTASTVNEGLEYLAKNDVNCVVSEYDMPGQDGIEFLETVRGDSPDLPFILYTGKGSEEIASDAISRGVTDYLQKESGTDQYTILANRITNAVDQARAVQEYKEHGRRLEQYEKIVETMDDVAFVINDEWNVEFTNESILEYVNIPLDDLEGQPVMYLADEYIAGENNSARFKQTLERVFEQESTSRSPERIELTLDTSDKLVTFEYQFSPLVSDGETRAVVITMRNITERKERERQMEEKTEELQQMASKFEAQYRTLFEEAPVMAVVTRIEDGQPIIEDCNDQFVDILRYDEDAVIGSELAEFYTPESAETLLQGGGYRRSLDGKFTREQRDLLTADGEVVETLLRAVPRRTAAGDIIGTVAMYIDITERESTPTKRIGLAVIVTVAAAMYGSGVLFAVISVQNAFSSLARLFNSTSELFGAFAVLPLGLGLGVPFGVAIQALLPINRRRRVRETIGLCIGLGAVLWLVGVVLLLPLWLRSITEIAVSIPFVHLGSLFGLCAFGSVFGCVYGLLYGVVYEDRRLLT